MYFVLQFQFLWFAELFILSIRGDRDGRPLGVVIVQLSLNASPRIEGAMDDRSNSLSTVYTVQLARLRW